MEIIRKSMVFSFAVMIAALSLWATVPVQPTNAAAPSTASIASARFDDSAPDTSVVVVIFNQHVWGSAGFGSGLSVGSFVYTDGNSAGLTAISSVAHNPGDDWAILFMSGSAVAGDTADTIAAQEGEIFTVAGALPGAPLSDISLTNNNGAPPLMRIYPGLGSSAASISQVGSFDALIEFQNSNLVVGSTEPVFGPGGAAAMNPITVSDISHANISGSGTSMVNVVHNPGDHFAMIQMAFPMTVEFGIDVFDCAPAVTDAWGNSCVQIAGPLQSDTGGGSLIIWNGRAETSVGARVAEIQFYDAARAASEPVYGSGGIYLPALLGDLSYSDGNATGSTTITGVNHTAGNPWLWVDLDAGVLAGDVGGTDSITALGVTDAFGNACSAGIATLQDNINPVVIGAQSVADNRVEVTFSELLNAGSANTNDLTLWGGVFTFNGASTSANPTIQWGSTVNSFNTDATGLSAGSGTNYAGLNRPFTTDLTIPGGSITDVAGNGVPAYSSYTTTKDGTGPVVISTSPADTDTAVARGEDLSMTFSEAMDTGFTFGSEYSVSPDPGNWLAPVWTNGDRTVTLSHDSFDSNTLYSVDTDEANIVDASLNNNNLDTVNGLVPNDWSFTSVASRSSGGNVLEDMSMVINGDAAQTGTTAVTLDITATNAVEMLVSNSGAFAGATWEVFATSKAWILTDGDGVKTVYAKFKNEDGDLSQTFSDTIELITDGSIPDTTPPGEDTTTDDGTLPLDDILPTEPPVMDYTSGRWIKTAESSTVYFLDKKNTRHAYPHLKVWQTYFGDDFSFVEVISAEEMASYSLGNNVPFASGTLVKFSSVAKVYLVGNDGELRWITSEAVAKAYFGSSWASLVKEISGAFITDYFNGPDLTL